MDNPSLMDAWLDEASLLRPGQDDESIHLNERFWQKIPEPKLRQEVAFHVLAALVTAHFRKGHIEKALEWSNLFDQFDIEANGRIDDGEKDLIIGRVYYALGDQDEAFRRWSIADRLSRGRCFQLHFAGGVRSIYTQMAKGNKVVPSKKGLEAKRDKKPSVADDPGMELDEDLYDRITQLSEKGNDQMDEGNFNSAIKTFNRALDLIPEPRNRYDAAGWPWASIGDAYFEKKDYKRAESYFSTASAPLDHQGRAPLGSASSRERPSGSTGSRAGAGSGASAASRGPGDSGAGGNAMPRSVPRARAVRDGVSGAD